MGGTVNSRVVVKRLYQALCIAVTAVVVSLGCGNGKASRPLFTDIGAWIEGAMYGDVAWGDYDSDGYLDLGITGAWQKSYREGSCQSQRSTSMTVVVSTILVPSYQESTTPLSRGEITTLMDISISSWRELVAQTP